MTKQNLIKNQFLMSIKQVYFILREPAVSTHTVPLCGIPACSLCVKRHGALLTSFNFMLSFSIFLVSFTAGYFASVRYLITYVIHRDDMFRFWKLRRDLQYLHLWKGGHDEGRNATAHQWLQLCRYSSDPSQVRTASQLVQKPNIKHIV